MPQPQVESWDQALIADPGIGQMLVGDPLLNEMRRDPLMQQLQYDPLSALMESDPLRAELAGQREFLPSMRSGLSHENSREGDWQDGITPVAPTPMPVPAGSQGMSMG